MSYRKHIRVAVIPLIALLVVVNYWWADSGRLPQDDPLETVESYLRATLARDYRKAYKLISPRDQEIWNEQSYALQYGNLSGFALEVATKLTEEAQVWVIEQRIGREQARLRVGYRVPTGDELAAHLFDWDERKLNALSQNDRERLLQQLESIRANHNPVVMTGQANVNLVVSQGRWRIFHDWASATPVTFRAASPKSAVLGVQLLNGKYIVKNGETLQTTVKVKNLSKQPIVASLTHKFDPPEAETQLNIMLCGALQPFTLEPGAERKIVTGYLFTGETHEGSPLAVTYEFGLR